MPAKPGQGNANVTVSFFESCVPPTSTAQGRRFSLRSGRTYNTPQHEAAKATYEAVFVKHRPPTPMIGALSVSIVLSWPFRKSDRDSKRMDLKPHTSRPDLDNLAKGLIDRLVALRFMEDDGQIAQLTLSKFWSSNPGIQVTISAFGE